MTALGRGVLSAEIARLESVVREGRLRLRLISAPVRVTTNRLLLVDASASLFRQWTYRPRPLALIEGAILTLVFFVAVTLPIARGRSFRS